MTDDGRKQKQKQIVVIMSTATERERSLEENRGARPLSGRSIDRLPNGYQSAISKM